MTVRVALVGAAVLIVVLDLLQVVFLGKGLGAIAGALIYTLVAVGVWRDSRSAMGVAALMPVIPIAVFTGLLGEARREALVDAGMAVVFGVQLCAALLAVFALWRGRAGTDDDLR